MSGKPAVVPPKDVHPKGDPRVVRTRDTLGDALLALIQEQPFDEITVQQILDRAGVSRSTFYTHYVDKQDLFLSDVEEFFEALATLLTRRNAPLRRLAPVHEFFAHVADVRVLSDALLLSDKAVDVRALGMGYFARSITARLVLAGVQMPAPELAANAHVLAGSVFSLLDWWRAQPAPALSPAEMDAMFHRLAWKGLRRTRPSPERTS